MAHNCDSAGIHAFPVALTESDDNNAPDAMLPLLRHADASADCVAFAVTDAERDGDPDSGSKRVGGADTRTRHQRADRFAVADTQSDADT